MSESDQKRNVESTVAPDQQAWQSKLVGVLRWFFTLLGIATTATLVALYFNPGLWQKMPEQFRQEVLGQTPANPLLQPVDLTQLQPGQRAVANWLGTKYRTSPQAIAALLLEAQSLAKTSHLEPHLIMAVIAVESNFHPYVRSDAGAQGLMQVMPKVHARRYEAFGGPTAAFDPISNMRVGVSILEDCIKLKKGSLDDGLMFYFGGGNDANGAAYLQKVKAEKLQLDTVAGIKRDWPQSADSP